MSPADTAQIIRQKTEIRLHEIVGRTRGAFGLSVLDLTSGETFAINEHNLFPQASAIKIPVLMEVYMQAALDKFKLTDVHHLKLDEHAGGSGVLRELDRGPVSMSLYNLCVLMILVSDNTATNILLDLVGMDNVNATMQSLSLTQTRMRRRMMDMAAAAAGNENVSTPAEAARLMEILYRGEFLNREVCDDILAILLKPKTGAIRAGLPPGTPIAFKPGSIDGAVTEWAIVMLPDRPYIVTVMESYGVGEEVSAAIRQISGVLHQYFSRLSRATPHGAYKPLPS